MTMDSQQEYQQTIWAKFAKISYKIASFGVLLGTVVYIIKGREFTKDELGFLAWPLTFTYLLAFFYMMLYLIHTQTSKGLRYFFIYPVIIFIIVLVTLAFIFSDSEKETQHAFNILKNFNLDSPSESVLKARKRRERYYKSHKEERREYQRLYDSKNRQRKRARNKLDYSWKRSGLTKQQAFPRESSDSPESS